MSLPRIFVTTGLGLTIAALITCFPGCGGGTPEIDQAELIRKEAPKADDGATVKPAGETPPAKEVTKP